jgi:hypothetical protein
LEDRCAKQSQFPAGPGGTRAEGRGTIVRNKAKLGQNGTSGGWRASAGPIMKNEPNLPIRARVGTGRGTSLAGPSLALIAPNKPNFPSSETKGKCFEGKELWLIVPTRGIGKTNPIARSGAPRRCPATPGGTWPERVTRDRCAKQSQFGGSGRGRSLSCQTKPIPGGAGRGEARGALGRGAKCVKQPQFVGSPRVAAGTLPCELRHKTYNQATLWRTDND